jgi:type II secretory pathway component PulF
MSEKIFNFAFKGTNSKGKKISGVVVERNEGAARNFLLNQNINIKSIRKQTVFKKTSENKASLTHGRPSASAGGPSGGKLTFFILG